jgi:hypothetical protein
MSRFFSQKISKEELADKIWQAWEGNEDFEDRKSWLEESDLLNAPSKEKVLRGGVDYKSITDLVEKDLSKVDFDIENMDAQDVYGAAVQGRDYVSRNFLGFQTLDNGLTFLGVNAGGDWEYPVYFIVYFDGQKLRGYVPTDGNVWNTDTMMAYGNDGNVDIPDADKKNLVKRGFITQEYADGLDEYDSGSHRAKFDFDKIRDDITARIVYKEK